MVYTTISSLSVYLNFYFQHSTKNSLYIDKWICYNNLMRRYNVMRKFYLLVFLCIFLIFFVSSCAPGNRKNFNENSPAGFFAGFWHGMISFFTLIISLFNKSVKMYEIINTGFGYDVGFFLGLLFIYGGGSHSVRGRSKKK